MNPLFRRRAFLLGNVLLIDIPVKDEITVRVMSEMSSKVSNVFFGQKFLEINLFLQIDMK